MLSVYIRIPTTMKYLGRVSLLFLLSACLILIPASLAAYNSNLDTLYISIPDLEGQVGDTITLDLQVRNFTEIVGVQFDFRFDTTALSFVDLNIGDLEVIGFGSFGFGNLEKGSIRFSWADFTDRSHTLSDNSSLFSLKMKVKQTVTSLLGKVALSEEIITAEYISHTLEQGEVRLLVDELSHLGELGPPISSLQTFPNPCQGETNINFRLAASSPASIFIYNGMGQVVAQQQLYLSAGEHRLPLRFPHPGRFWYCLQTPSGSQTQAVMVVE